MKRMFLFMILVLLISISGCITGNVIKRPEVYFCPEDDCKAVLIQNLNEAEKSIYFMQYSLTDEDIANLLVDKSKKIEVKGVMEKQGISSKDSKFKLLRENNVAVRYDSNENLMHSKVFIIDGRMVISGSLNPTKNGFFANNENVIIIEDEEIAKEYSKEFFLLFNP